MQRIYSFGMIMYFVATGKQPFANCAHDENLALNISICGIRPEINKPEAPECYINIMKMCWNSDPDNRPNVFELSELILGIKQDNQFKEAEEYRKANHSSIENYQP